MGSAERTSFWGRLHDFLQRGPTLGPTSRHHLFNGWAFFQKVLRNGWWESGIYAVDDAALLRAAVFRHFGFERTDGTIP